MRVDGALTPRAAAEFFTPLPTAVWRPITWGPQRTLSVPSKCSHIVIQQPARVSYHWIGSICKALLSRLTVLSRFTTEILTKRPFLIRIN